MVHAALLALAALLSPQAEGGDLVARWTFDGDVRDTGPAGLPTKAAGRLDFIDSPVGPSGRMAVFNGVDAHVRVDPAAKLGAGATDFTLSAWIFSLEKRGGPLFSRKGWSLAMLDGGVLQFKTDAALLASPAGVAPPAQWNHVVVSVKRGTEGNLSRIVVNGETVVAGNLGVGDFDLPQAPLMMGKSLEDGKTFAGFLDDVRLYSRALEGGEAARLTDEGMAWIRPKLHARIPFPGKFELAQNDVVVFAGGENARVGQDLGYLETLLSLHAAGRSIRFRSMAWEGDTVYEQLRPLNFGTWKDQFRRTGASVIFAQFGQIESLEGKAGVDRFAAAYETLLGQFGQTTKRIVLVSPTPFGRSGSREPDLLARNEDLKLYVEAIRTIAAKNGFLFVDLATKALAEEGLTRNGLHLSTAGHWVAAKETARQLEIPGFSDLDSPDPRGVFPREAYEQVRGAIRAKNRLWSDSWRPTNWAFLAGDRMEQPSSRDHEDRRIRWFPVEIQQFPAMIRREESKIEALVEKK